MQLRQDPSSGQLGIARDALAQPAEPLSNGGQEVRRTRYGRSGRQKEQVIGIALMHSLRPGQILVVEANDLQDERFVRLGRLHEAIELSVMAGTGHSRGG